MSWSQQIGCHSSSNTRSNLAISGTAACLSFQGTVVSASADLSDFVSKISMYRSRIVVFAGKSYLFFVFF